MRSKHLAILVIGVVLAGCHKRPATIVALPPPTVVTVVVPVAVPVPVSMDIQSSLPGPVGPSLFEEAELAFDMGDYAAAIQDYENYLRSAPNSDRRDQVLFHVSMAYVLRNKPPADWTRATASLSRLVKEHPDSPLRPAATLILSLRSHAEQLVKDAKARDEANQQLSAELERLKRIDADRGKHP
jgi:TolA-binding protein